MIDMKQAADIASALDRDATATATATATVVQEVEPTVRGNKAFVLSTFDLTAPAPSDELVGYHPLYAPKGEDNAPVSLPCLFVSTPKPKKACACGSEECKPGSDSCGGVCNE